MFPQQDRPTGAFMLIVCLRLSVVSLLMLMSLGLATLGFGKELELRRTKVPVTFVEYRFAILEDERGVPVFDRKRFQSRPQLKVTEERDAIVLENECFRATLLPTQGRLHSFIDRRTGHEQLWVNPTAIPLGAKNDTGVWLTWGGIEHVLPRGEHGTSHLLSWTYQTIEEPSRVAVRMESFEPISRLHHVVTYSARPHQAFLETQIAIENPTDGPVRFSHWTTATLAPGAGRDVTADTEIIVPADQFIPDDPDFNDWMKPLVGATDSSPLRVVGNWKDIGDLMASPLDKPYYAVVSHISQQGLVRTFHAITPGFDIWGWGFPPTKQRQREFSADLPTNGYIELWNGATLGFDDEQLGTLDAGQRISWTETTSCVDIGKAQELRSTIESHARDIFTELKQEKDSDRPSSVLAGAPLAIERSVILRGEPEFHWMQTRGTLVPSTEPFVMATTQPLYPTSSHDYRDIYSFKSDDNGATWTVPTRIPALARSTDDEGTERVAGDLTLSWHAPTQRVIATGKTFTFRNRTKEDVRDTEVAYAVFDPNRDKWSPLKVLELPEKDHEGNRITGANAGCTQPALMADGSILLPIRYQKVPAKINFSSTVVRCNFDGERLHYVEHGTELSHPQGRGVYEPSVIQFKDRFYLTLRADHSGYVAESHDGLNYTPKQEWYFDDGTPLGSYNTQQHWVKIGANVYLVYTRRGADNDEIFRHRAPLFIAQMDPRTLRVIRSTEQLLVPKNHSTLGNSGVMQISDQEAWIVVSEYTRAPRPYSPDDKLTYLVKLRAR